MKQRIKSLIFRLLRKDPEAVVVSFWSGDDDLAQRMVAEIVDLVPDRRHIVCSIGRRPALPAGATSSGTHAG